MTEKKVNSFLKNLRGASEPATSSSQLTAANSQGETPYSSGGESVGNAGLSKVSLSQAQFAAVNKVLNGLHQKTNCPAVILSDHSGLVIAHDGNMDSLDFPTLAALAAADYAATSEMSRMIGETKGFKMHYHEGPDLSVYVTGIIAQFIIVVVFSKETTFGMVKVLSTKAVKELVEVFSCPDPLTAKQDAANIKGQLNDCEFTDELTSRLDAALVQRKDLDH